MGERRCKGDDGRDDVEELAIERVSQCLQKLRTFERTLNYGVGVRRIRQTLLWEFFLKSIGEPLKVVDLARILDHSQKKKG